ncbi:MAG TPA: ATP synthase F0 subunit C [Thermoanaerobaculia bacterium]|nr:ATP synthase F0 subunit C [Thermoanaerobaculia bacterium]
MTGRRILVLGFLLLAIVAAPAVAAQAPDAAAPAAQALDLGILGAAFAIGIAAAGGALGQGKAVSSACSAMARNPGAAANIRFALILGLALIESLVLYALLIAMRGAGIF